MPPTSKTSARQPARLYEKLFGGHTVYITYLSFDKVNRFERNGRMTVWGLNEHKVETACEHIMKDIVENYKLDKDFAVRNTYYKYNSL